MKKHLLLATLLLQLTVVFGQTFYNQHGVHFGYSKEKYNTIERNGEIYDQYEITIFLKNNNSISYVHEPRVCRVRFSSDAQHPSSNSEIDFVQNGEAHGYVEYTDGTPLPENLNNPKEEEKYGRVVSRMVLEPNQKNECVKYILVKSDGEFPEPSWNIEFDNQIPIIVNGSSSLVATWVDRQAKGISLNNVSSWPMSIRKPFAGTNCGYAKPIGNKGDVASKKTGNNTDEIIGKVEIEARYDGDWNNFLSRNINSDTLVNLGKPKGDYQAVVHFAVNTDGTIGDIVKDSGDTVVAEELIRVIKKSSGKWIPAQQNGKAIKSFRKQPLIMAVSDE